MALVSYPSEEIPGHPSVVLELPEGWVVGTAPAVAFAAFSEKSGTTDFTPNCVVAIRRASSSISLEKVMAESQQELVGLTDYAELTAVVTDIGQREVSVREYAFTDDRSRTTVFQLQVTALVPVDENTTDVVMLTVSHGPTGLDDSLAELRELARSLRISRD